MERHLIKTAKSIEIHLINVISSNLIYLKFVCVLVQYVNVLTCIYVFMFAWIHPHA